MFRTVRCLTWIFVALSLSGGRVVAASPAVTEASQTQDNAASHVQAPQNVSDALGQRLDQMMQSRKTLPHR